MSRGNPEPWFRPSRNTFYVTINGVQHNLRTADKVDAIDRWHKLLAKAPEPPESQQSTVMVILATFLEWSQKHNQPATYDWQRRFLHSFVKSIPHDLKVMETKPFHVTLRQSIVLRILKTKSRGRCPLACKLADYPEEGTDGAVPTDPCEREAEPPCRTKFGEVFRPPNGSI